jgi:hypothetical protein
MLSGEPLTGPSPVDRGRDWSKHASQADCRRGRRSHPMSTIALFSLGLIPLGGVVGGP